MTIAIAECRRFVLGKYTIQTRPRQDSPSFPVFIVYLANREIGRQFSYPQESDCDWMLLHPDGRYATESARCRVYTTHRAGRPENAEKRKREPLLVDIPE